MQLFKQVKNPYREIMIMKQRRTDTERKRLPRLYMVSNNPALPYPEKELPGLVRTIASHLPAIIQLREKHLTTKKLYELALLVKQQLHDTNSLLCINERFDITLATGADGTHYPENSCPLEKAKAAAPGLLAGKSTHSLESALSAEAEGADYLIFGPVFETASKKQYGPPMGLAKLYEVCRNVSIPVYAIGGITPENTRACVDNGAYGIAALSIFHTRQNLGEILENFNNALCQCT